MIPRLLPFFSALALAWAITPSAPAHAQTPQSLAADTCISYAENGTNGYRLSNACDYAVEIAFCSQPKSNPGLCLTTQAWTRETIAAKAQGQAQILPDRALDLFACRSPGAVEILASGMARCASGPPAAVVAIMSAASLKNPSGIITDRDYPPAMHRMEGTTRFDLMVGPDGKPQSCATTTSSGHDALDKAACNAFLKRARFSPPKDDSGNLVTGRYRGSVTWKAP